MKKITIAREESLVIRLKINFDSSFVRSGIVGEWEEYFNDKDCTRIEDIKNLNHLTLK
ncbi:hypothetical protein [Labilibaculum sp.]|uniref:hypothetical protein n=1 Tax=Labilibaculum sp. TaxID=2060723 RepID=UPI00356A5609